jgi:hypothetical protein
VSATSWKPVQPVCSWPPVMFTSTPVGWHELSPRNPTRMPGSSVLMVGVSSKAVTSCAVNWLAAPAAQRT